MFTARLQRAQHLREYSIHPLPGAGWEVTVAEDRTTTRQVRLHDWHRVERRLAEFQRAVDDLRSRGWELTPLTTADR